MSAYTGPVSLIPFENGRGDRFVHITHKNVDNDNERIFQHYKENGYYPAGSVRDLYMVNGSLVEPGERDWQPRGYPVKSAHLR